MKRFFNPTLSFDGVAIITALAYIAFRWGAVDTKMEKHDQEIGILQTVQDIHTKEITILQTKAGVNIVLTKP